MSENMDAGVEEEAGADLEEESVVDDGEVSDASQDKDDTDWKAIAIKERDRAENYKTAFDQKRAFVKAGAIGPVEEEPDEDRPVTLKDLKAFQQDTLGAVTASKEDTLLAEKITDPAKRIYVKQLLDSRIVRTGTSEEALTSDINAALAIADSHKKDKVISELTRAANNKPHAPTAGSSEEKPIEQKPYKWTAQQVQELEKRAKALGVKDLEKFKKDAWENQKKVRTA